MKRATEDDIIGNLKGVFVKKTLRSQIHTSIRPSVVNGNIALAMYRGMNVSRIETIDEIIHHLKKKFPKASQYIKDKYKS